MLRPDWDRLDREPDGYLLCLLGLFTVICMCGSFGAEKRAFGTHVTCVSSLRRDMSAFCHVTRSPFGSASL